MEGGYRFISQLEVGYYQCMKEIHYPHILYQFILYFHSQYITGNMCFKVTKQGLKQHLWLRL